MDSWLKKNEEFNKKYKANFAINKGTNFKELMVCLMNILN